MGGGGRGGSLGGGVSNVDWEGGPFCAWGGGSKWVDEETGRGGLYRRGAVLGCFGPEGIKQVWCSWPCRIAQGGGGEEDGRGGTFGIEKMQRHITARWGWRGAIISFEGSPTGILLAVPCSLDGSRVRRERRGKQMGA